MGTIGTVNEFNRFAPVVMASSENQLRSIKITDEEISTLQGLVKTEDSSKIKLANLYLEIEKVKEQTKLSIEAREKFCIELKTKYNLDKIFGNRNWHVEIDIKSIVAD